MTQLGAWLTPEVLRALALALLHFLWQGMALAAVAGLVFSLARKGQLRYLAGVALLVLMVAAPVVTTKILLDRNAVPGTAVAADSSAGSPRVQNASITHPASEDLAPAPAQSGTFVWLVELWSLGVLLFSIRAVGGVLLLERLRRESAVPFSRPLLARCHELQWRMGVERVVHYCESKHVSAPAVVGWLRPVVMLPMCALTGLSEPQLYAVIAHELAHIKRMDAFVNLFQVAAESLLFYHPAVWWLNRRIRAEREDCCDDAAVAVCGNRVEYARALTLMEEWRAMPQLALAANSHPLAARIRRVLLGTSAESSLRTAGLSVGILCLTAAILAGNAFFGVARSQAAAQEPPGPPSVPMNPSAMVTRPERPRPAPAPLPARFPQPAPAIAISAPAAAPTPLAVQAPTPRMLLAAIPTPPQSAKPAQGPAPKPEPGAEPKPQSSYIDSLKAEGIDNVSLDDLIAMKVQGITAEYVRGIHATGLKPSVEELIGMKVQGITPEYIRALADQGVKAGIDEAIGLKVQGVTPDYIRQMKALGLAADADTLIGMKVQGITPEYVTEIRAAVPGVKSDELIGMKVQGVTPAYVKQIEALGLKADADTLIGMKVQGVTPEYIQSIRATGLNPGLDDLIGMKVQGVTSEYIKSLQSAGLKLDVDDVIGAKVQGITPEFIEKVRSRGFKDLDLEKLIALKHTGILD